MMSTYIHYSTGFVSDKVHTLLDTMTEISSILYSRPEMRCQKGILRLHNQTFLRVIACEEVIGRPQVLSEKKFYGQYFHSLIVHAPIQHRITCLRSTNTEQQERHFNAFSSIFAATLSKRPGEIITPGIIRMQAEESKQRDTVKEKESSLGKLACLLPKAQNTIILHRIKLKYPHAFQAHLEKIADFLHCGEGIWWQHIMAGVEFLDGPDEKESQDDGPPLHHFRTHTLKSEEKYLKDCWKECITNEIPIPHPPARIYDDDGNLQLFMKYTRFLKDDDSTDDESSDEEVNENDTIYENDISDFQQDDEELEDIYDFQQVGEYLMECAQEENLDETCHNEEDFLNRAGVVDTKN